MPAGRFWLQFAECLLKRIGFTVVKNAISNIVRGGATAAVAIVLPHFLTKSLDTERFAAWSLMLQIAAYANYLDFGLQTALSRFVAQTTERGEFLDRNRVVNSALALLLAASFVALMTIALLVWLLPHIVPSSPPALLSELRLAVLILAGSTALSLPFSTFSGILIGVHRNEYPAFAIGGSRIIGAVAILLAIPHTHSLIILAACIAVTNLIGGFLQSVLAMYIVPTIQYSWSLVTLPMMRQLASFGAGLTVWSLSGLLVTGMDLTVLGYFRFGEVGYYAVGASLVTFVAGLNGAVTSALMTPLAALHAQFSTRKIRDITLRATTLGTYINLCLTYFIFIFGHLALLIWVGSAYASESTTILKILIVATTIRLAAGPYASMLIATGQQKHGIAQGIVEGVSNLISSIILGRWLGAVGVALGTLIGAFCGLAWSCILTITRAKEIPVTRRSFLQRGILQPIAGTLPLLLYVIFATKLHSIGSTLSLFALSCVLTYFFSQQIGGLSTLWPLTRTDKQDDYNSV